MYENAWTGRSITLTAEETDAVPAAYHTVLEQWFEVHDEELFLRFGPKTHWVEVASPCTLTNAGFRPSHTTSDLQLTAFT